MVTQQSFMTSKAGTNPTAEYREKKSRFIAKLAHVETLDEANAFIASVKAEHPAARHHVPAWVLSGGQTHSSDDGEPHGTAGMPILQVLHDSGLRDVCCVVTRYFGGILLGIGGLVRAYATSTQEAIEQAREDNLLVEMTEVVDVTLTVPYAKHDMVIHLLETGGGLIQNQDYATEVTVAARFRAGTQDPTLQSITELMQGKKIYIVGKPHFASLG